LLAERHEKQVILLIKMGRKQCNPLVQSDIFGKDISYPE